MLPKKLKFKKAKKMAERALVLDHFPKENLKENLIGKYMEIRRKLKGKKS